LYANSCFSRYENTDKTTFLHLDYRNRLEFSQSVVYVGSIYRYPGQLTKKGFIE